MSKELDVSAWYQDERLVALRMNNFLAEEQR